MTGPRVSVIMGVHQAQRHLPAALESLVTQTFTDFEMIIVDDASTDQTSAILSSCRDPRLRVLRNEQNVGLAASLNRGLAIAQAPFIARLDADDIAEPHRLQRQFEELETRPTLDVLASWTIEIDDADRPIGEWALPASEGLIRWGMAATNVVFHPTVMMRRTTLEAAGGYDPRLRYAQDYDLFTRLLMRGRRIDTLPERLVRYRRSDAQISSAHAVEQQRAARDVRRRYLAWLVEREPHDEVLHAASLLRNATAEPATEFLPKALRLERQVRLRCLRNCDALGRRMINRLSRRALLHLADRLRRSGRVNDAQLLWREAVCCGWQSICNRQVWRQAVLLGPAMMEMGLRRRQRPRTGLEQAREGA